MHLEEMQPTGRKIILNEENSLFNTIHINRVFEFPYENYQKIDPERFRNEIGNQNGSIRLHDFNAIIERQSGPTFFAIIFDKEAGRFISSLRVDFFENIDTLKEVYCIKYTKEFRDCRLSFILSIAPDMEPVIIYIRSRNDKLFYLMHPNINRPMFFAHGHIGSKEFLESAKEAYKLYKLEKNAPPLTEFDFDEKDVRTLDTILGMQ